MLSIKNIIRIIIVNGASLLLLLSYLCFQNIIPGITICGSGCEYWWTWIIPFSRRDACFAVCVPRNQLYQPLMMNAIALIIMELSFEGINLALNKSKYMLLTRNS